MLDISNDHKLFDGNETLEVVQAGTDRFQVVRNGHQFPVTAKDAAASDGTYTQSDVKFNLPVVELLTFVPLVGDFVRTVDGLLWPIGMVEKLTLKTRLRVWCKRCDLNPALATQLKVFKPINKVDNSNTPYTEWQLVKTAPGHVNEVASEFDIQNGWEKLKITHNVFFTDQFPIQAGFRIEDCDGNKFNVQRVTGRGTNGAAMVCDVVTTRTTVNR